MASVTLFGYRYVIGRLTGGFESVVTRRACAQHFGMIDARRGSECRSRMAGGAIVRGTGMARILAGRRAAAVTAHTGAEHLCVIHRNNRSPDTRAMALGAIV